jgi:beta-lactamase regulating signal transducer with metallopeptidase domain
MEQLSFFLLNIVLNSLLAFLTTLFLIEILIGLFRVKQGRYASYLRMIPIVKLALDPFLYDFSRWSYLQGINPLLCEEGSRTIGVFFGLFPYINEWLALPLLSGIQMTAPGNLTFTLADMIAYITPPLLLHSFAFIFLFVTVMILVKRLTGYLCGVEQLNRLTAWKGRSLKKVRNSALNHILKKYSLKVNVLPDLKGSPFVAGLLSSTIFFPQGLSRLLSQKEYEAALAHEVEHIRHKDNLVRLTLTIICSMFWWIPTHWLRNRIEEGLEIGCDHDCKKYHVDPVDLAAAICKSARHNVQNVSPLLTYHLAKGHQLHRRIDILLAQTSTRFKKTRFVLAAVAACVAIFGIFLGRYWIF